MRIAFKNTSNITFALDLLLLYPFKLFFSYFDCDNDKLRPRK